MSKASNKSLKSRHLVQVQILVQPTSVARLMLCLRTWASPAVDQ